MDYDDLISDLKRDAEARKDAVAALVDIHAELGCVIDRLSGKPRKKPRTTGRGVTTDDVRRAVSDIRTETPGLSNDIVKCRVREKLKQGGRQLNGISLRLAQVLGEEEASGALREQ